MFKYLHEILGLLHDFVTEGQEPGRGNTEDGLAVDETSATSPKRAFRSRAPSRQMR